MAWVYLLLAGLFETAWAVGMKKSEGFTRPGPTIFTAITMGVSLFLLAKAMRSLPLGTAYAVWTGIGAVGAVTIGILFLGEPKTAPRLLCLTLILLGIIGLKVFSNEGG